MGEKIYEALSRWVIRVANDGRLALPEEIAALPEVAKLCLDYFWQGTM